ncbi:hypothetical protein ACL6C3_27955 [Capilliphycus salinus ALCB114379]|uniref:hypothetical protein n=1 Tax=Capilliphycus salinus TaxID=2768948 RepID=UPI0039A46400
MNKSFIRWFWMNLPRISYYASKFTDSMSFGQANEQSPVTLRERPLLYLGGPQDRTAEPVTRSLSLTQSPVKRQ